MDSVLHWPPVVWALRIALVVVRVDGLGLFTLVTARFFRWKHVKRLVLADLPQIRSVGGQVAGAGATVELEQDKSNVQIALLEQRVEELYRRVEELMNRRPNEEGNRHG